MKISKILLSLLLVSSATQIFATKHNQLSQKNPNQQYVEKKPWKLCGITFGNHEYDYYQESGVKSVYIKFEYYWPNIFKTALSLTAFSAGVYTLYKSLIHKN